jgi:serine protease Do
VLMQDVTSNGPAFFGGLQPGDIITQIDSIQMTGFDSLISYLAANTSPGQAITLTVWRNGQLFSTTVTLGERP